MDSSLLARLSGELRNKIWRFSFLEPEGIDVTEKKHLDEPDLLQTCSQIREEAHDIYYAENLFRIAFDVNIKTAWLSRLGSERANKISNFHVRRAAESTWLEEPEAFWDDMDFWMRCGPGRFWVIIMTRQARTMMQQLKWYGIRAEVLEVLNLDRHVDEDDARWVLFLEASYGVIEKARQKRRRAPV